MLLSEDEPPKPIARLAEFDLLRFIHPSLQWDNRTTAIFDSINDAIAWYRLLFLDKKYDAWKVYFFGFIDQLSEASTIDMCKRLEIREHLLEEILTVKKETQELVQGLLRMKNTTPAKIYELLKKHTQEHLLYLMAKIDREDAKKHISLYLSRLQDTKLAITGKDIAQLGVKPGPVYTKVMNMTLDAKLDGIVKSREEEMGFVKELLKKLL